MGAAHTVSARALLERGGSSSLEEDVTSLLAGLESLDVFEGVRLMERVGIGPLGGWSPSSPGCLRVQGLSMSPLEASLPLGGSTGASGAGPTGGWTWVNPSATGALGAPRGLVPRFPRVF